jgi:plasmid stabilization system protein ParE
MSLRVTLRPVARSEYVAAAKWYEDEKPGLGTQFVAAVEAAFAQIAGNPLQFAEEFPTTRCAPVEGFRHYCIFYKVRKRGIDVISVFHTSRDPSVWQSRA